jgi:hypothetical protein
VTDLPAEQAEEIRQQTWALVEPQIADWRRTMLTTLRDPTVSDEDAYRQRGHSAYLIVRTAYGQVVGDTTPPTLSAPIPAELWPYRAGLIRQWREWMTVWLADPAMPDAEAFRVDSDLRSAITRASLEGEDELKARAA